MDIKPVDGFIFNRYSDNDVSLPFKSNSFDLITVLQVLHHVKFPISLLNEIKRILKPNGIVFIREHDRKDKYIDKLIRLEHLFYSQLVDDVDYDTYLKTSYEKYFSREKLVSKMKKIDFKLLHQKYNLNKYRNNPTNYYNILFQINK
jgi:ubiquinone/menaquinone biosynthesis C-methylase UbiE